MTVIVLPKMPFDTVYKPRPLQFGVDQTPDGGGRSDRILRPGDRWVLEVVPPKLDYVCAMGLLADLRAAAGGTVRLRWPQPGLTVPRKRPDVRVQGASQVGTQLSVNGGFRNMALRKGQFISLMPEVVPGRVQRFLHQLRAEVRFDAAGEADLALCEMLRFPMPDNAPIEVFEPEIEGTLALGGTPYDLGVLDDVDLSFTITERQ